MSHTEIANLFGKFTRLDNPASRNTEGTGLGLYLAKSIVDLHRGTIRVKSRPGNGSTFTVTLPRQ
jgi:two-component system OmpR family sensor kinase